jgi:hypothetical protein
MPMKMIASIADPAVTFNRQSAQKCTAGAS